ncbi:MAG: DUF1707 domain-containing protein [Streptosporangiaceae bacterium]
MQGPGLPRAPIDDAGRDRLIALLREHYAQGRLDDAELGRRTELVLAAQFADDAAAALAGLPSLLPGAGRPRPRLRRRGPAQAASPGAAWVPTGERFRDPTSKVVMRVWVDPADGSRHYVPEPES